MNNEFGDDQLDQEDDNNPEGEYVSRRGVDYANIEPSTHNSLFKIKLRYWYTVLLVIIIVLSLVMIGSITTPRWSEQGAGGHKWRSGILRCGGCQGQWEGKYISEILTDAKDNDIKGWENTFNRLYTGGIIYVLFESLSLLFCAVWIVFISFLLQQKRIFKDLIIYIVIGLALLMHSVAIAGWFGSTGAKFNGDCDDLPGYEDDDYDICATHGPSMAIFIEAFLFVMGVFFLAIYRNRRNSVKQTRLL